MKIPNQDAMTKILEGVKEMGWAWAMPSDSEEDDDVTYLMIGEIEALEEFDVDIFVPPESDN